MKILLVSSLLISTASFAQTLDVNGLKALMTQRKATLERIYQGMTKKLVTTTEIPTELGPCELNETAIQSVLKIEGDKIIVHSKEKYSPASTPACAGFESQEVSVLFYEDKPSLELDLQDLEASRAGVKSISRSGEIVTMNLVAEGESVTVKYDLSKPSFKNTILVQDSNSKILSEDMADINVNTLDLTKVLFCASADSDECSEGDFSDILFY